MRQVSQSAVSCKIEYINRCATANPIDQLPFPLLDPLFDFFDACSKSVNLVMFDGKMCRWLLRTTFLVSWEPPGCGQAGLCGGYLFWGIF